MKKLLKQYGFNSDMDYYQYIVDSVFNGQIKQSTELFKAMPKINKKAFLKAIFGTWNSGLIIGDKLKFIDLM